MKLSSFGGASFPSVAPASPVGASLRRASIPASPAVPVTSSITMFSLLNKTTPARRPIRLAGVAVASLPYLVRANLLFYSSAQYHSLFHMQHNGASRLRVHKLLEQKPDLRRDDVGCQTPSSSSLETRQTP